MHRKIIFSIFVVIFEILFQVKCATVILSGIEQLSLNAKRESKVWTAIGSNGTEGNVGKELSYVETNRNI